MSGPRAPRPYYRRARRVRTRDRDDPRFAAPLALLDSFCCDQLARIEAKWWNYPYGADRGMTDPDRFTPALSETTLETRGHAASMCGHAGRIIKEEPL